MKNARKHLFQVLLIIIALVFVITIRYICDTQSTQAGTFSKEEGVSTVTFSEALGKLSESGAIKK